MLPLYFNKPESITFQAVPAAAGLRHKFMQYLHTPAREQSLYLSLSDHPFGTNTSQMTLLTQMKRTPHSSASMKAHKTFPTSRKQN